MSDTTDVDLSPLVFSVTVAQSVADAFALFTDQIGTWWPASTHSIGQEHVVDVLFEPGLDGRLYERMDDGTEYSWGEVLAWDPPHRFVMTWHPSAQPVAMTEVEVVFTPVDAESTTVQLTHRNWHRLGDVAAVARKSYSGGWVGVLDRFTRKAAS